MRCPLGHAARAIRFFVKVNTLLSNALGRGLVVSSPPANEETGAMGHEIESRQGIGKVFNTKIIVYAWEGVWEKEGFSE
jgi:hypothetical protein